MDNEGLKRLLKLLQESIETSELLSTTWSVENGYEETTLDGFECMARGLEPPEIKTFALTGVKTFNLHIVLKEKEKGNKK